MKVFYHFVYSFNVIATKLVDLDTVLAEALGVEEVLSWIKEFGRQHVTVETDSLVTIQALGSSVECCQSLVFVLQNAGS